MYVHVCMFIPVGEAPVTHSDFTHLASGLDQDFNISVFKPPVLTFLVKCQEMGSS